MNFWHYGFNLLQTAEIFNVLALPKTVIEIFN